MVIAGLARHLARQQVARRLELHQPNVGLQQRGVDPLAAARALALEQRGQDAVGEHEAGGQIGDRQTDAHGSAAGLAVDGHQAGQALGDLVETGPVAVRAGLAEARDAAVDQARIDLRERLVVDSQPMLHVRAVVLDDRRRRP